MIQEADDGDGLLEFGLEFWNQRHGLGVQVVQVEDQQRGLFVVRRLVDARDGIFILALYKLHLHAQFARRLLNFGEEEEILNETEDGRGSVFAGRRWGVGGINVGIIPAPMPIARRGNRGWRTVGAVAVHRPIAVVHRADKRARAFLPSPAFALRRTGNAISGLRGRSRALLEEFLLLAALVLVGRLVLNGMRGMRRMRLR